MDNNTDQIADVQQNTEFPAMTTNFALSPKRKKDSEKELDVDWKQSNDEIDINFKLDSLEMDVEQASNTDVTFSNTDVIVRFSDGRKWACEFCHPVDGKKCKVQVKKHKIVLKVKKKEPGIWKDLMALSVNPNNPDVDCSGASLDSGDVTSARLPEDLPHLPTGTTATTETSDKHQTEFSDEIFLKEEPLYKLSHTKHDYIEKDDTFTLHVYVKEIKKDTVVILCDRNSLTVKFQTLDQKFLQLHPETNDETTFMWKVNLKGEIDPDKCRHRVTGVMIEVKMVKVKSERWGALEASQRKEVSAGSSKSDCWIPTNKNNAPTKNKSDEGQDTASKGNVAFDELRDVAVNRKTELDKENKTSAEMGAMGVNRETYIQKPTCKVSPMNKNLMDVCVRAGYTGLDNLGNTCFMNSVLQALSNTTEFRDFFLDSEFQNDINSDNPLGMGGKLAVSFAVLLRVLWSGKHYSYAPSKLKNIVAQKATQFNGFAQHDAQEFMAFLLDGLHEDLNRIKKKPYTETVDSNGRPDEVVADEAWEVYKKRNDSFVVDLFQGQYKSKLTCPICGKISITFDPFLYLSLPLPKKKRLLPVIFSWKDPYKKPVQLILRLPKECTTEALKEEASRKTGIKPSSMRVFEIYKGKIYKFYGKGSDLSAVQSNDIIIISEVLTEDIAGEPVHEIYVVQRTVMPNQVPNRCSACRHPCPDGSKLKRCTKCFKVGYCDHTCQKNHWTLHKSHCKMTPEPVGSPFIVSIPESRATFSRLSTLMEAYARYSVDVFQPPVKKESNMHSSGMSSSSSQSSGSMSSLDSQSSCSSSCTITADQEPAEDRVDFFIGDSTSNLTTELSETGIQSDYSSSHTVGNNSDASFGSLGVKAGSMTSLDSTGSGSQYFPTDSNPQVEMKEDAPDQSEASSFKTPNLPEFSSFKMPRSDSSRSDDSSKSSTENDSDSEKSNSIPTKKVMGIKSDELEQHKPLFHIKPVNQDGVGIRGPDGERLKDQGDEPLDLSYKQFLSIDWKNDERCDPYVLVQTKDMEYDEDPTLQYSSTEESGNINIQQCLDLFTEPEVLSPEEAWYCPSCKEHREATKQMSIWRLPHTLIIQLKRFSFRNFIWRDKIDKMVEFPVRGLDLSPYSKRCHSSELPPIYDLYAVVNHYGGILGGHYTSFVRCADLYEPTKNEVGWRLCDDSRVTSIGGEKGAVTRGAYLLFYRKRQPFRLPHRLISDYVIDDQSQNAASSDDSETEKEPSYMKDQNLMEEEVGTSSTETYGIDDFGDNSQLDNTPLLSDHKYQRMYGVTGEDEVDNQRSSPSAELDYTDMEAVD